MQKWAIFNQDCTPMPVDAAFNVLVGTAGSDTFVHTATAGNISFNYTFIDHGFTNRKPNALVFATQNWNPGAGAGQYNDHPIGVWYSHTARKWSIFNQDDTSSMLAGADFNVVVIVNRVCLPLVMRGT